MNILEEIASGKTLAMTDRVILLQLMICSVSSFGYYRTRGFGLCLETGLYFVLSKYYIYTIYAL
ncbi:MAG: hypothetical protein JETT_1268 [Candidatus Jettenia ecosi]|uniref:Uncharacterized protein n=1 Tax=Candidatus Jettenia ecosi TaxID=2494326 RepID=A0A533QCH5_9BACT|nr:MAG: hypothetical protein JETT_1268 [Candidatus Jettenia ecosi]